MRFVLRSTDDAVAHADAAMLAALGLPGGGVVRVGATQVRVTPRDMRAPNDLAIPGFAFTNGAGRPGGAVDVTRLVVPQAARVYLERDGDPIDTVPRDLISLPVATGDRFPTAEGEVMVLLVEPESPAIVTAATTAGVKPTGSDGPHDEPDRGSGLVPSMMIAGLENELELLIGWLRLLTQGGARGHEPVAGVTVSGPMGSGRSELVESAADTLGLTVTTIDLRTVTTPDRLLATFERALSNARSGTVLLVDRLDPLLERESGVRHQAAAVTRWFLDTVAATPGVAVVVSSTRPTIGAELDAQDLLRRTLEITAPTLERRRALLSAAIDVEGVDIDTLANATPGFSALDISTAVLDARAATSGVLTTDSVLAAIRATPPSMGTTSLGSIPSYGFERVANLVDVKQVLTETVIWQLTDPQRFSRMGIQPPRGLLLHGPPGTGKTFVIRALAHESGAAFFSVKGAELLDKWVGESERGVREVFARAGAVAPAIVFFDELDALAPVRGSSTNNVTDTVVAALLTELDGVARRGDVFVIGATNRIDLIDPALLRPGRFEVHLLLDLPGPEARQTFFEMTTVPLDEDVNRDDLVAMTEGMSFADLDGLLRGAAIRAMRDDPHATTVAIDHVRSALGGD
ncbi:MAG TPA: AAA family ATPase [Acidimicrobiia bacterium]|nr:AAA family ATPase [Acidimicrobiia bacterium]